MLITSRQPTLTGVASGGMMVRPTQATLLWQMEPPSLGTVWICRVTLAPPIDDMPPQIRPTLLTERTVGPGVG